MMAGATDGRRRTLASTLAVVAVISLLVAVVWLSHHFLVRARGEGQGIALLIAVAWMTAAAGLAAFSSDHRLAFLSLIAVALAVVALNWPLLERHVAQVYLAEHVLTQLCLSGAFALTLRPSPRPDGSERVPLITALARRVHGSLPPHIEVYTRQVTMAWSIFFLAIAILSMSLYLLAPIQWWSTFANLMTGPLVILMFAVEYAVRLHRFPDFEHVSILDGIRAYWR